MVKKEQKKGKYISIADAATILGISRIAVYKQVKNGDIKSIKIGKAYGIPFSALNEIRGGTIDKAKKHQIERAVKKVFKEYGELLIRLGKE